MEKSDRNGIMGSEGVELGAVSPQAPVGVNTPPRTELGAVSPQAPVGVTTPPRTDNSQSSAVIQQVVAGATDNQSSVVTGFRGIVSDYQKKASKEKTIFRFTGPVIALVLLGVVAIIIDYYFPKVRFFLAVLVVSLILVLAFALWQIYMRVGKSSIVLAWRMRKASRYLHVCQVPEEYITQMLPKLGVGADGVCHCKLAGSSGDGFGFFPSQSANINLCRKQVIISQDVDMNLFYDALALDESNVVQTQQPGFCWLRVDEDLVMSDSLIRDCVMTHPDLPGWFLSGHKLSHKIATFLPGRTEHNYPAMTYTTEIEGPSGKFGFDIDVVFALNLPLWPSIASEWPTRPNRLLPQEIIDRIQEKGCYLVHKHCILPADTPQHMHHQLDWRITFAEAETELFRFHSSKEALKLSYVIIKFVIKHLSRKRKRDFPTLKSYHLKTVFLWLAESSPEYDLYKISGNKHLGNIFLLLLLKYEEALKKKHLSHYFMPSVNILAQFTEKEFVDGIKLLQELRQKPIMTVEYFDKAWIGQKGTQILLITLVVAVVVSQSLSWYFRHRSSSLKQDVRESLLETLGEQNRDLLYLADDPDKLKTLAECLSVATEVISNSETLSEILDPWQLAIIVCRKKLGL